jgi:hypothetical protein
MSLPSTQSALNLLDEFLEPVRNAVQKEAETKSYKDMITIEEAAKPNDGETSPEQRNLGKEQTEEAEKSSNVASVQENTESDGERPEDEQGTQTLSTDDEVVSEGNIGPMREQEIEQKVARAERLGSAIVKVASDALETGKTLTEHVGDPTIIEKCAHVAAQEAQEFYEGYMYGMLKRAQDEVEIEAAGIDPATLQKMGGVSGLLDKVAQEFPEAVLPEGAEVPELGADLGAEGVPAPEAAAPAEVGEADLDELAGALEAAGVTPEDLEQAFEDVQSLQEAGVQPEELAAALEEINAEAETAAPVAPEEGGMEGGGEELAEAPAESDDMDYKEASSNFRAERVSAIKNFLTR